MIEFADTMRGVFDQLNPFNTANLVLYFTWLVVFSFTMVAVWRSDSRLLRFLCFIINQLFSVGVVLSWTLTSLLAYTYWRESLAAFAATIVLTGWLFRRRRPRAERAA